MPFSSLDLSQHRLTLGGPYVDGNALASISSISTADIGLKIVGTYGQTGDLQQWLDDSGSVLAKVSSAGVFTSTGFTNAYRYVTTVSTVVVTSSDYTVEMAGSATAATLPNAAAGQKFELRNGLFTDITVTAAGGGVINGVASFTLAGGQAVQFINAGSSPQNYISTTTTASSSNAALTVVYRNIFGDFSANTIAANSFSGPLTGNASTATKLATPRTINGIAFDGSAPITIATGSTTPLSLGTYLSYNSGTTYDTTTPRTLNTNATPTNVASTIVARDAAGNFNAGTITAAFAGNASTATKFATPTTINSLSFDGSAPITITTISGNAGTAAKLATPRYINGVAFDGSGDITITAGGGGGLASPLTVGTYLSFNAGTQYDGTAARQIFTNATPVNVASTVVARDASGNFNAGTITAASFSGPHTGLHTGNTVGNADTATKLATPRNIDGVAFDGSASITSGTYSITQTANTTVGTGGFGSNLTLNSTVDSSGTGTPFTLTGGYLQVNQACMVMVTASITWPNTTTGARVSGVTHQNSSGTGVLAGTYTTQIPQGAPLTITTLSMLLKCAANDRLWLYAYQNSGGNLTVTGGSSNMLLRAAVVSG